MKTLKKELGFLASLGIALVLPNASHGAGFENLGLHEDEFCRIALAGAQEAMSDFTSEKSNPALTPQDFDNLGQKAGAGWKTTIAPYNNGTGTDQMPCGIIQASENLPDHLACKLYFVSWQKADTALTACLQGWRRLPDTGDTQFVKAKVAIVVMDAGNGAFLVIAQPSN